MRFGRALWLGLGLVAALVRAAAAQSASDLFQQGIRAYQRLEFEAADYPEAFGTFYAMVIITGGD